TTGLDPRSRTDVWEIVRALVREGTTLLLTTQYLDEADQLADQIAVLDNGRIVAEGTPVVLKRRIPGGHIQLQFTSLPALHAATRLLPATARDEDALTLQVPGDGSIATLRRLLGELEDSAIDVEQLTIHTPDLDDVFFAVTGHATTHDTELTQIAAR
ncbi:MAG: ABC transporter, partial [Mycobacterium sp.]